MNTIRKILSLIMIAGLLLCVGCDGQGGVRNGSDNPSSRNINDINNGDGNKESDLPPTPPPPKSEGNKTEVGGQREMKVKVYYPDESGLKLVGVNRSVEINDQVDKYKAALKAVMTPPTEKNLTSIIPNNSSLISVKIKDGTAIVDLDNSIKKGFVGGSTGEEFLIGSIVNTLTEFKEVKDVKFLINGEEVETLSGHMDLSEPIKRMNELMKN